MKSLTYLSVWFVLVAVVGGLFLSIPPKANRSQAGMEATRMAAANLPPVSPLNELAMIASELSTPEGMTAAKKHQDMMIDVAIETSRIDAMQKAYRARMQAGK